MLRTREIYSNKALTVSVIESVETWRSRSVALCYAAGRIEPIAVVVAGPDGEYALDVDAQPIDRERLSRMLASSR